MLKPIMTSLRPKLGLRLERLCYAAHSRYKLFAGVDNLVRWQKESMLSSIPGLYGVSMVDASAVHEVYGGPI